MLTRHQLVIKRNSEKIAKPVVVITPESDNLYWYLLNKTLETPDFTFYSTRWFDEQLLQSYFALKNHPHVQEGHLAKDCPDGDKKTCYRCSGKGHIAMDCPSSQRELDRCAAFLNQKLKKKNTFFRARKRDAIDETKGDRVKRFSRSLHKFFPTDHVL